MELKSLIDNKLMIKENNINVFGEEYKLIFDSKSIEGNEVLLFKKENLDGVIVPRLENETLIIDGINNSFSFDFATDDFCEIPDGIYIIYYDNRNEVVRLYERYSDNNFVKAYIYDNNNLGNRNVMVDIKEYDRSDIRYSFNLYSSKVNFSYRENNLYLVEGKGQAKLPRILKNINKSMTLAEVQREKVSVNDLLSINLQFLNKNILSEYIDEKMVRITEARAIDSQMYLDFKLICNNAILDGESYIKYGSKKKLTFEASNGILSSFNYIEERNIDKDSEFRERLKLKFNKIGEVVKLKLSRTDKEKYVQIISDVKDSKLDGKYLIYKKDGDDSALEKGNISKNIKHGVCSEVIFDLDVSVLEIGEWEDGKKFGTFDKYTVSKVEDINSIYRFNKINYIDSDNGIKEPEASIMTKEAILLAYNTEIESVRDFKKNYFTTSDIQITQGEIDSEAISGQDTLNSMIGLQSVKDEMENLVKNMKFLVKRKELGLKVSSLNKNYVFLGNPGTGKTTVAQSLSSILYGLGVIQENKLVITNKSNFVGELMGQTEKITAKVLESALGGVLFIDEAYNMIGDKFGEIAIDIIMDFMEKHKDDLVVIIAGYPNDIDKMLKINPGLSSRFTSYIHFEDYTPSEMYQIFTALMKSNEYKVEDANGIDDYMQNAFEVVKNREVEKNVFSNGRSVRNFFEKVIESLAIRLSKIEDTSSVDEFKLYSTFTQEDIENTLNALYR